MVHVYTTSNGWNPLWSFHHRSCRTSGFMDFRPYRFPHLFPPNLSTSKILIYFNPFGPMSHICFQQPQWHMACLGGSTSTLVMSSDPTTFTFIFESSGFASLCVCTSLFFCLRFKISPCRHNFYLKPRVQWPLIWPIQPQR
jgi:hypothetical protein